MHIEPGIVEGPKIILSYLTAGGAGAYALSLGFKHIKERGLDTLVLNTIATTALVFVFFQVFPHYPVGVSEVHLILGSTLFLFAVGTLYGVTGSTLFLIFGVAPAAFGLACGLLLQGLFFAPFDLPQFAMNVTTLLVPLFALQFVAHQVIARDTPYVELKYRQALALSTTYQAGIVSWVAFWAVYGQGVGTETVASVATFGVAYLAVIVIEPLADLAVLAGAKALRQVKGSGLLERRLYHPA